MIQKTVRPSLDTTFDALADRSRRRLLVSLSERDPQNTEDALVPVDISDGDVSELKIEMRHHHLPKLEEVGFIEWDRNTNEVWKGPRFDEIRPLLELLSDHADELPDDWP